MVRERLGDVSLLNTTIGGKAKKKKRAAAQPGRCVCVCVIVGPGISVRMPC